MHDRKPVARWLPMERRNYDIFVNELISIQKIDPDTLKQHIDSYQSIVSVGRHGQASDQSYHHSFSLNLVDIIKSLIKWDRTSSLKYLAKKVSDEVAEIPFELHLALSLSRELVKPSAGSMFYFPYLEELLTFVDNVALFFRLFRLFTLTRVSAVGPSKLENLTAYKLASRFGDAEEMSYLTANFSMPSEMISKSFSGAITCQSEIPISMYAYHTEQLPFNFDSMKTTINHSAISRIEADFFKSTGKLSKVFSLVSYYHIGIIYARIQRL
jgi:hypothetical protein